MDTMEKIMLLLALACSYGMLGFGAHWMWNKLPWKPEGGKTEIDPEAFEAAIGYRVKAMIVILILSTALGIFSLIALMSSNKDCKAQPDISINCPPHVNATSSAPET